MARRTAAQNTPDTDNDEQASGFDFTAVEVTDSTALPERTPRVEKVNPLQAPLKDSLDRGVPRQLPAIPVAAQKDAENYLRRAAVKLGCGIKIRPVLHDNGTVTIHFQAKAEKSARNYTVGEVREWARGVGYQDADLLPKVQRHVSDAYREAHNLPVAKHK